VNTLLSGIVGSTAYGLAHPGSDVDRLGLFAVDTVELHGLRRHTESVVTKDPDLTLHEAAKWCRLALGGNPTVMELVWLPDELYEVRTPLGDELIGIRSSFLSAKRVRNAYLGYADQQFRKLESRGDGTFSADTRKRTEKHARHLWRLCYQGLALYTTGDLPIRVENPEAFREFGEAVGREPLVAKSMITSYEHDFNTARSVLPAEPDDRAAEAWLRKVRAEFYQ
jgi:predicted nucleotidyltransferase